MLDHMRFRAVSLEGLGLGFRLHGSYVNRRMYNIGGSIVLLLLLQPARIAYDRDMACAASECASVGTNRKIVRICLQKRRYFRDYIHYEHAQLKQSRSLVLAPVLALAPTELGLDNKGATVDGVDDSVAGVESEVAPSTRVPNS